MTEPSVPAYDAAAALGRRDAVLPPPGQSDAVLETRDLSVAYGTHQVLAEVFCHFPPASVTAIMGPSGCGKSTLVKTLNRTLELTPGARIVGGDVWFQGTSLYAPGVDPKAARKRIGIIHQKPITFPMSIVENVLFGARFHGVIDGMKPRAYAERYLERVGLLDEVKDRLDAPGHRLSGGQQQRLCLARTLANRPEVILMDEPCSAIDPAATQRIEELIFQLKAEYTIVIVTHNIAQARRVSDHAIFMFGGRIVEAGASERLFREPRTELAQRFIAGIIG